MSKQFRFYLTPSDIENLCVELRARVGLRIFRESSRTALPVEMESAIDRQSIWFPSEDATSVRCFFASLSNADLKLDYYPTLSHWKIQHTSEVIEFSGCDFNGVILLIGRFYFQTDMLVDNDIVRKRKEFIDWADSVFRIAKSSMHRSSALNAYVGRDAKELQEKGLLFASSFTPDRMPVFD